MNARELVRGAVVGAGLMYLLDPRQGRRRRARMRDKLVHATHKMDDAADAASRDLRQRTRGWVAAARSRLRRGPTSDAVLAARVRSAIGRLVTHPGAIDVIADGGRVTLCGPVLAHEVEDLVSGVALVQGVREIENRLEVHERAGDVPGLQGGKPWRPKRPEFFQAHWAPGARVLAGALGGALAIAGLRRGGALGGAAAAAGLALATRAVTNLEMRRLTGIGAGRRAIDLRKTINVQAPVERVFAFWQDYENFPRFMSHLKLVRRTGDGRSHWVAEGPGGVSVEWDAETTAIEPNRLIAWRSIAGSPIDNAGIVRFEPNPQGGTRIGIQLTYNPPAGAIGHALASVLGADPKRLMDDDLARFRSLVEIGKTTAHGETVTDEEVRQRRAAGPRTGRGRDERPGSGAARAGPPAGRAADRPPDGV